MNNVKNLKSNVFYKVYLINFLCTLIFIIIISVVAIGVGRKFIESNIINHNQYKLDESVYNFENTMQLLDKEVMTLFNDETILGFLMSSSKEYEKPIKMYYITEGLIDIVANDDLLDGIYLIDADREIVISHNGKEDLSVDEAEKFSEYVLGELNFSLNENNQYEFISYFEPMADSKKIAVKLVINKEVFDRTINLQNDAVASFVIVEDNYYSVSGVYGNDYVNELNNFSIGVFPLKIDNQNLVYYKSDTLIDNVYIAVLKDNTELTKAVNIMTYITIATSLFLVIVGALIMYYVSLHFYKPLRTLSSKVNTLVGENNVKNEYQIIEKAVEALKNESTIGKEKYLKELPTLVNDRLGKLLSKHYDKNIFSDLKTLLRKKFNYTNFLIIILKGDSEETNHSVSEEILTEIELNTVTEGVFTMINQNESVIFLNTESNYEYFISFFNNKKIYFIEQNIYLKWCVSDFFQNIESIDEVYKEVLNLSKSSFFKNKNHFMGEGDKAFLHNEYGSEHLRHLEESIALLIENEEENSLVQTTSELIRGFSENEDDSLYIQFKYFNCITNLIKSNRKSSSEFNNNGSEKKLVHEINKTKNIDELNDIFVKYVLFCVEKFKKSENEFSADVNKAVNYIKDHFNEDLSLTDIAGAVFLSAGYLSNIFKNETGYTIYEYMTEVRMEHAKFLLQNEINLKIKDISILVGYNNVQSFVRQFKKFHNTTPRGCRKGE